jgi:uncharacterized protein YbcI
LTPSGSEQITEGIAQEILRVQERSYGVGASKIDAHLLGDLLVVVLDVELAPSELTMVEAGRADAVKAMRESYQAVIGPTFPAIVEHFTGRRVIGFISTISIEPLFAVEIFRLDAS